MQYLTTICRHESAEHSVSLRLPLVFLKCGSRLAHVVQQEIPATAPAMLLPSPEIIDIIHDCYNLLFDCDSLDSLFHAIIHNRQCATVRWPLVVYLRRALYILRQKWRRKKSHRVTLECPKTHDCNHHMLSISLQAKTVLTSLLLYLLFL